MGKVFTKQSVGTGFDVQNTLNTNFTNLETGTDRLLSRYADAPNSMQSDLDMNNYDILNVGTIDIDNLLVDGAVVPSVADLTAIYTDTVAAQTAAETAQTAAETAETNAEAAQAAAEAAAAGVSLPSLGTAGQILQVNSGATALENHTPTSTNTADAVVRRDGSARAQFADPSAAQDAATKNYVDGEITTTTSYVDTSIAANIISSSVTYQVGSGGDYATLNDALEDLSHKSTEYLNSGITVTLNLVSGFTMAEQIYVEGKNLGWIRITGTDATTTITASAISTVSPNVGGSNYYVFEGAYGAVLPVIDQQFYLDTTATVKSGILLWYGSSCFVESGAGITNTDSFAVGLYHGCTFVARSADFSSTIGATGLFSLASTAQIQNSDFSGFTSRSINAQAASTIAAPSVDVTGTGGTGVYAITGATVSATGADATGRTTGYEVSAAGIIYANSATGTLSKTANTVTADGIIFQ